MCAVTHGKTCDNRPNMDAVGEHGRDADRDRSATRGMTRIGKTDLRTGLAFAVTVGMLLGLCLLDVRISVVGSVKVAKEGLHSAGSLQLLPWPEYRTTGYVELALSCPIRYTGLRKAR